MTAERTLMAWLLALTCAACSADAGRSGTEMRRAAGAVAGDSIHPMSEMIARFQADLPAVRSLGPDAATSRDDLIRRFVAAVEDNSTAALRAITLDEGEFAYLYFPTSVFAHEPYAQPPAVNWLLLEQNSMKGLVRLLREYGGRRLVVEGHRCMAEPRVEGPNRLWDACLLGVRRSDGRVQEMRLFGSIMERDGRYKLLSLANRL